MPKAYPSISYGEYLKTRELLSLQTIRSAEFGSAAHDEMLFVIIHQTYELWFKQILTELESVRAIFLRRPATAPPPRPRATRGIAGRAACPSPARTPRGGKRAARPSRLTSPADPAPRAPRRR